jgi:hypothetical protein
MAGFIRWLASQYEEIQAFRLAAEKAELRDQYVQRFSHPRTPSMVADLLIGLRYLLRFAEEIGAVDRSKNQSLWERGCAAIQTVATRQSEHQRTIDPVERFPELIRSLVSSGRAYLASMTGDVLRFHPAATSGVGVPRNQVGFLIQLEPRLVG